MVRSEIFMMPKILARQNRGYRLHPVPHGMESVSLQIFGVVLPAFACNFLAEFDDAVDDCFRSRRAARNVDIYRNQLIDPPNCGGGIALNIPAVIVQAPIAMTYFGSGICS